MKTTNYKEVGKIVSTVTSEMEFSGVIYIQNGKEMIHESAHGYSNRAEQIKNKINTRFGIASGCKLFTAIGICQLIQAGKLTVETKINECLAIDLPYFDKSVTIHHLLTHSSGIPDYFDEAVMENFEDLWKQNPMYQIKELRDFLPLFQHQKMMFPPGAKFHYNNAGFILLGLVIEQISGESFTSYIEKNIFGPSEMQDSGYFSLDQLPANTATGYIDSEDGSWRTNIYSIPIKGGADGGAFTTALDMSKLWTGLLHHRLLNEEMTQRLLTPVIEVDEDSHYGYGIWIRKRNNRIFKYHVMGYDPGVSFASSFYPESGVTMVIPSNKEGGPHKVTSEIEKMLMIEKE
ncbi:serine hydrolase domain-containing protein [Sutcliffiella halmapala]|uniref:serine hydrolase domain-containing protein n=1 Tax=Sutcliffiella halmapala TaxID=79882 RepID=UPI0009956679|nr:serine hydrolase [Sutcliffiella halmapala]